MLDDSNDVRDQSEIASVFENFHFPVPEECHWCSHQKALTLQVAGKCVRVERLLQRPE